MEEENKLYKSLLLSIFVLIGLIGIYWMPDISIFGYQIKKIDIFSDLREKKKKVIPKHFINKQYIDSCKSGITCLEDYSDSSWMVSQLMTSLSGMKKRKQKLRIAMFGDSFIEGDVFCSDIRDSLQTIFGGNGVGFMPITSEVSTFRTTICHSFEGFQSYTIVKDEKLNEPFGAGGFCFNALENNFVKYSISNESGHLNHFNDVKLFYTSKERLTLNYVLDDKKNHTYETSASPNMRTLTISNIHSNTITFRFPVSEKLILYGTSFEDTAGIIIDNFGLRGNSGIGLAKISDDMQMQFDSLQKYNVIILQYGLNIATPQSKDFDWYIKPMVNLIERLKKSHPQCVFILMSVSDRSVKKSGEYQTMESIPLMVETQRKIAQQSKIAFWDLYTAMGGENSMINLVDSKPALANKDYTHLNKSGGKKIAGIFVQTLLYELEKYEAKKNISIYNDSLRLLHK
jgi:hypothetical protein